MSFLLFTHTSSLDCQNIVRGNSEEWRRRKHVNKQEYLLHRITEKRSKVYKCRSKCRETVSGPGDTRDEFSYYLNQLNSDQCCWMIWMLEEELWNNRQSDSSGITLRVSHTLFILSSHSFIGSVLCWEKTCSVLIDTDRRSDQNSKQRKLYKHHLSLLRQTARRQS